MLNNAIIERQDYKVHFRSYSDKLYGVRVIIGGEMHYIINDRLKGDMAIETLYRLIDASSEYLDYGFIMLQEDNRMFIDADYKFSKLMNGFIHKDSDNVVDINKYKYTLKYGIDKYRDRWDL